MGLIRYVMYDVSNLTIGHLTGLKAVIDNLRMPGINGMELIKKLKNMNPFLRTILMTAFESNDELFQEYTKKQIINGFFQKPIRLHNLREEVNNQIHTYQLQRQKSLIKI